MNKQEKMVITSDEVGSLEQVLGSKVHIQGIVSVSDKTEVKTVEVELRTSGDFQMTTFAMLVMNFGLLLLYKTLAKGYIEQRIPVVELMNKLAEFSLIKGDDTYASVTREEMLILQSAVSAWMSDRELKRDSDEFNTADYISAKILLLDIKQWLSVIVGM